jgi:hypothetical protein
MRVESELKLNFDDVLIRPKRSVAPSRASVDLKREHRFRTRRSEAGWTSRDAKLGLACGGDRAGFVYGGGEGQAAL